MSPLLVLALLLAPAGAPATAPMAARVAPAPPLAPAQSRTLVAQVQVAAPPEDVWRAFATAEGQLEWMGVAQVEVDLRVGGTWRTTYDPQGTLGDSGTIEHEIVSLDAPRMLAWRTVRGPKGFDIDRFARVSWVLRLEPVAEGTRVTLTGTGWQRGPGWDELYAGFERANAETLARLVARFAPDGAEGGEAAEGAEGAEGAAPAGDAPSLAATPFTPSALPTATATASAATGEASAAEAGATPASSSAERLESYRAHLAAAEATLRLDETAAAAEWLDRAPADLRSWEWRWLLARADQSLREIAAHAHVAYGIRMSADGRRIATASYDGTARLWDALSGAPQATLAGHTEGLWAAVFTPNGSQVVTAAGDGTARLWDAQSGAPLATLWEHDHAVSCVDVSPDGTRIAASSYRVDPERRSVVGLVQLFDANSHDELATLEGGNKPISLIRFSPDGTRIAASSWDSSLHVWDLASGALQHSLSMQVGDLYSAADAVAWSPDGTRLAGAGKAGAIVVFDAASGAPLFTLLGHRGFVGALAFHPGGAVLASGGEDGTVRLWDLASGASLAVLHGDRGFIHGLAFSPDGVQLHSVSSDGTRRSWAGDPAVSRGLELQHENSYGISIDRAGERLASGGAQGSLRLFSLRDGAVLGEFDLGEAAIIDVGFSPDGARLAACFQDGSARTLDPATGATLVGLGDDLRTTTGLDWSHDGRLVAVLDGDDSLNVVDATNGARVARSTSGPAMRNGAMGRPAFSRDDRLLVAPFGDEARVLDAATGAEIRRLPGPGGRMSSTLWLADGRRAAGLTASGHVALWDTASGQMLWSAAGHDTLAYRLAVSAGGHRLVTGANELILWDTDTGAPLLETRVDPSGLYDLSFSPDGTRLVFLASSGRIGVLDALPLRDRLQRGR